MDELTFATHLERSGHIDGFTHRPGSGAVWVTYRRDSGWALSAYEAQSWLLARTGGVKALMLLENYSFEACAMVLPVAFALLAEDDRVLCLDDADDMAALGQWLHRGLAPGAYAQALARTQSPARRQDLCAEVVSGAEDLGEDFAGRRLPWVRPPMASRSDGRVTLTFYACRTWPQARIEQWQVTAPVNAPASWDVVTVCEAA